MSTGSARQQRRAARLQGKLCPGVGRIGIGEHGLAGPGAAGLGVTFGDDPQSLTHMLREPLRAGARDPPPGATAPPASSTAMLCSTGRRGTSRPRTLSSQLTESGAKISAASAPCFAPFPPRCVHAWNMLLSPVNSSASSRAGARCGAGRPSSRRRWGCRCRARVRYPEPRREPARTFHTSSACTCADRRVLLLPRGECSAPASRAAAR
jgi:hypothetical protein